MRPGRQGDRPDQLEDLQTGDRSSREAWEGELLLDQLPVSIYLLDPEAGEICYANPAAHRSLGYPSGSLIDQPLSSVEAEPMLSGVDPGPSGTIRRTGHHLRASGDPVHVEVVATTIGTGKDALLLAVSQHLERWEERIRELESSAEDYHQLTELSLEPVLIHDGHEILDANPAAADLVGAPSKEALLGHRIRSFVAEEALPRVDDRIRRILEDGEVPEPLEIEGRRLDGGPLHVQAIGTRIQHEGQPAILTIVRDVTEARQTQEALRSYTKALERSNRRLEQFASAAAHDLKEPVRSIDGFLDLLERRHGDQLSDGARELVEQARDGAGHLVSMLEGLMAFTRAAGETQAGEVDLGTVVDEVETNLAAMLEETSGRIERERLPTVPGDRDQLTRVLQNLIANAIKFRHPDRDPTVTVEARRDEGRWIVEVTDNGIGMDPASVDQAFDLFSRLHPCHEASGTGAGLALTKEIVEAHGGQVWVEETSKEGTTMAFSLPSGDTETGAQDVLPGPGPSP